MRLQVDAKVGRRIMEYVWPARRHRNLAIEEKATIDESAQRVEDDTSVPWPPSRKSLDFARTPDKTRTALESSGLTPPPLHGLSFSRSVTDLRNTSTASDFGRSAISHKSRTTDGFRSVSNLPDSDNLVKRRHEANKQTRRRTIGDAAEMRSRSSQKTFILVKISR
jgi:hypothetical protein